MLQKRLQNFEKKINSNPCTKEFLTHNENKFVEQKLSPDLRIDGLKI